MNKSSWFTLFLCFSFFLNSQATHIAGGEITYRYIGDSTNIPRHYIIRLSLYQDISGISLASTANINYTSSCNPGGSAVAILINTTNGTGVPLQSAYDCADQSQPGSVSFAKWVYQMDIVLPINCSDWDFYWSSCCRNPAITNILNPSGSGFVIKSQLNNLNGQNSSPVFSTDAARQFCANSPGFLVLSQQAVDLDGDSLFYYLSEPLDDPYPGVPLPWSPGYSTIDPITTLTGMNLNPATGVMIFKPTTVEVDVFKINVDEYRFDSIAFLWIKKGTITREVQIPIVNTCRLEAINWHLQTTDSLSNKIVADCGTQELTFNTSAPIACSSISPDGTDFLIYKSDGTLLPVVSANGNCVNGYTTEISIQLNDTISQNDSMHIISYVGSDFNTLTNYCGFDLPVGDSLTLVVSNCPNIGLQETKIISAIYPNPFENSIEIKFENSSQKNVLIFNSNGQLLTSQDATEKNFRIDLSTLPKGIYLVQVGTGTDIVSKKIIKK